MPLELISLGASSLVGFVFKMMANSRADKQQRFLIREKEFKMVEDSIGKARKFGDSFTNITRRFIVVMLFLMLLFILVAGMFVPTNLVIEIPNWSFLGIFGGGGGIEIITVDGLVAYPYLSHMVSAIVGFYFGQGSAKR